ncbi:MAG TPA: class I SAM-dependent methyltransferase [Chloroflexota bacterium]
MSNAKPAHLSGEYGAWFKDPLLAAAYPARPPYPDGVISLLRTLIQEASGVVLDVGCGTGELARRLSPSVERVDAVDFSEAMLALARRLPGGDATNIRWTLGAVEDVALNGPYALVSAGECLHWMDLDLVMSRFADVLAPNGSLAVIDRNWDAETSVWQRILPIIERYSPVQNYQPFNLIEHLVGRGLFEVDGQQRFGPEPWRPTLDEYLECRHSQRGLSRTHMGPAATASFDAEVAQTLDELTQAGAIVRHDDRLELGVSARVTWGRPQASGSDPH